MLITVVSLFVWLIVYVCVFIYIVVHIRVYRKITALNFH